MLSPANIVALLLLCFPSFVHLQELPELRCEKNSIMQDVSDSKLYLQLEKALVEDNYDTIEELRAAFVRDNVEEVVFGLDILVVDSPHYNCDDNDFSFCNTSYYTSELCYGPLYFSYLAPSAPTESSENIFVLWSTLVHGNLLSFIHSFRLSKPPSERVTKIVTIVFLLDKLQCNPTHAMLACNIDGLFSWVSLFWIKNDIYYTWHALLNPE